MIARILWRLRFRPLPGPWFVALALGLTLSGCVVRQIRRTRDDCIARIVAAQSDAERETIAAACRVTVRRLEQ